MFFVNRLIIFATTILFSLTLLAAISANNTIASTEITNDKIIILVVGDSLSSGYNLPPTSGWVELLGRTYLTIHQAGAANIMLINASISGDTTAGGVARLPSILQRTKPNWVLLELGGNDGLRGASLIAMEQNLRTMIRLTYEYNARPALLGIKLPPNYGASYTAQFAAVYRRVAKDTQTPLLPLFIKGIENNAKFFQSDQSHPNAAAQPIIANNVRKFLAEYLE